MTVTLPTEGPGVSSVSVVDIAPYCTVLYSRVQNYTVQYSAVWYSIKYDTAQHSAVQYVIGISQLSSCPQRTQ